MSKERMFKCPYCEYQFETNEPFIGICPRCLHKDQILFKWINPKYRLEGKK